MRLELEGGGSLHTRLLVGADGRGSQVRRWAQVRMGSAVEGMWSSSGAAAVAIRSRC